ncbi:hypothetical protein OB2597_05105 [Pseudooceanicola batsensis HTCC2597]|uniref:HTH cro/C1-type domain-containing protein n=1 Tax=Pseudooceanicola batsensis (strain ATCC BAA-863 / DSM 15984 / KCTC 12145 / HTCC2597) TaxID=252305 RepID=A3TSK6_PSEBH|nr:hypothetical protein OB2597_05105 [Pseudooceanicola batsensis HTCC2597]
MRLTQSEAGNIVGGGPRAFQKYEKGVMPPSDAAVGLLEILKDDPGKIEILKRLRESHSPVPVQGSGSSGRRDGATA